MAREIYRIEIPIEVTDRSDQPLRQAQQRITRFEKAVERTEKQLQKVSRTKWQLTLHALDRASHVIRQVGSAAKRVASGAYHITLRVTDLATRPLRAIGRLATSTAGLLGAGIALGGPVFMIGGAIRTAAEFEQQMANVRAVTGATGEDFQRLTERARELGATMPFTTSQVADAMGFLGMAGFTVEQILAGIEPTLLLASAGMLDLGEAADIATNVLSGMRMEVDQLQRVVDVMAATAASANTTVSQMGLALSYAAPAAADAGVRLEEVSAAIGFLGNAGIQGERAGTALRQMLLQLNNATGPVAKRLKEMGLNLWDAQGAFIGLIPFMEKVEKSGLRLADVANAFGTETAGAVSILLNMGTKAFKEYVEQLDNAAGRAEEMASIQEGTFLGSIRKLQSAWESFNITLGMKQIPGLKRLVELLTDGIGGVEGFAEAVGTGLNNAFNQIANWIESIRRDPDFQRLDFQGKVTFVFDDIMKRAQEWYQREGKEQLNEIGNMLAQALANGLEAGAPRIAEAAVFLGKTLGTTLINEAIDTITNTRFGNFILGAPGKLSGPALGWIVDKIRGLYGQTAEESQQSVQSVQSSGVTRRYASGGPILGPTALVSLSTGRTYAIAGEAGPEWVVPNKSLGGHRRNNISISGPLVQMMIQVSGNAQLDYDDIADKVSAKVEEVLANYA